MRAGLFPTRCICILACLAFHFIASAQIITTIAGNGIFNYGGDGGPATAASVEYLHFVVIDSSDNVYVVDNFNSRVRKINAAGIITTFAGDGSAGFSGDGGPATAAQFISPEGITLDKRGNIYIADANNRRIRKVDTAGVITTIAGTGAIGFGGDGGPATSALFDGLVGIVADTIGNIYISDGGNFRVRKVDTSGMISTIAGTGGSSYTGDGGPATLAQIQAPGGLALDKFGNLYIAIDNCNCVRKVSAIGGIITTIAGDDTLGYSGDGGPATNARLYSPADVAVDSSLNVYISDHGNNRIRKVDTLGIIHTIAGTGAAGYSGDGGPATNAQLYLQMGINLDRDGNMYICDWENYRLRKITLPVISIASSTADTICAGSSKVFTAIVTNDAATPQYQWKLNNANVGTNASVYASSALHNGDIVACVLSYPFGDTVKTISNAVTITVDSTLPYAGDISGTDSICLGHQALLTDTATGGVWSVANTNANISSGMVTGIAIGIDTIIYAVSNACGTTTAFFPVTVFSGCPDEIKEFSHQNGDVIIEPNPNRGIFTCTFPVAFREDAVITITNLTGQKILETTVQTSKPAILKADAPAGIYFISVVTEHWVCSGKIVLY